MIILDKRKYERIVSELIDAKDIRNLADRYALDRIYYYHILKDISLGRRSPNYRLLKRIAGRRKLSEDFVVEQAKSVLNFFIPYYQSLQTDSFDYYKILNVSRSATDEEIRRNWIELMKAHHPDMAGADGLDTSKKINEAYEVLSNSSKREAYDNKHLPPTPVIVPHTEMKKYYYAGAFMVIVFLAVMYASGSGLIFQSPEEKEKLVREFEAPDMPNTVYKGDYLDTEKVDKKISEIKPIEQSGKNNVRADVKENVRTETGRENAPAVSEEPATEEMKEIAETGAQDRTASAQKSETANEKTGEIVPGTETAKSVNAGNSSHDPRTKKTLEITGVTPDKPGEEVLPAEPAPSKEKTQEQEKLLARTESGPPATVEKSDEKFPEKATHTTSSPKTWAKNLEPVPNDYALNDHALAEAKSETVNTDQKAESGAKQAETEKAPGIKLAEKPAAAADKKPELTEISMREKVMTASGEESYTVREGDSLWTIAHRFGMTTGELESLNGISDGRLRIGEKIVISGTAVTRPKPAAEVAVKRTEPVPAASPAKDFSQAQVTAKTAATVRPPVKTDITEDFNPKLATPAVAIRDTGVQVPVPVQPPASPDRESVYGFVTDYVSAYKNRDLNRVKALFMPDAVENGVSISRVINSYSANFTNMDIMKYDVKVSAISVENSLCYVHGEFFITFKDQRTGALKNSRGQINWVLSWTEGSWKIRELKYKIVNTDTVG